VTPRPNWTRIRDLLWERAEGRCEVSGRTLDRDTFDVHHRLNKGMGGTTRWFRDDPTNLLALDPAVHNGSPASVHGSRPWSEMRGYLLPKLLAWPPDVMPVYLHGVRWVFLSSDGLYVPTPASRAIRLAPHAGP
jgi:hypothetical protein